MWLAGVTGIRTVVAPVNLGVMLFRRRHGWPTAVEVSEVDPVFFRWKPRTSSCVDLVVTVVLGILVDVVAGQDSPPL